MTQQRQDHGALDNFMRALGRESASLARKWWALSWKWRAGTAVGMLVGLLVIAGIAGASGENSTSNVAAAGDAPEEQDTGGGEGTRPPESTVAPSATNTPKPTSTPAPTATPKPPTATPSPPENIKGLTAADIKLNLEKKNFKCSGPTQGQTMQLWTCKSSSSSRDVSVDWMGQSTTRIRSVDVTVLDYSTTPGPANALDVLKFLASLPYENAQPEAAQAWVEANIGTSAETIFGSARFSLYGKDRTWVLEMVALGAQ